jgi:hypothetical protein
MNLSLSDFVKYYKAAALLAEREAKAVSRR